MRKILIGAIRIYQLYREGKPSPCRFTPGCSTYAIGCLEQYGLFKGGWLAVRRIGRCRPFGGSGYDPVPD